MIKAPQQRPQEHCDPRVGRPTWPSRHRTPPLCVLGKIGSSWSSLRLGAARCQRQMELRMGPFDPQEIAITVGNVVPWNLGFHDTRTHVNSARRGSPIVPDQVISAVGLTTAEARSRLIEQGANAVQTHRRVRLITRLGNQLKDPLLLLLIAAVVLTISVGDFTDAVVIAMVIVVNTAVAVIQEV